MVIYELLGLAKQPVTRETGSGEKVEHVERTAPKSPWKPTAQKPLPTHKGKTAIGSVLRFISENVSTAKDTRTEMRSLIRGYRDWCAAEGLRAIDLNEALGEVEALCSQIGI